MRLQNGRPTDTTGRLDKEIRTYDFFDKLGIEYQRIDHEAAFTMEVCSANGMWSSMLIIYWERIIPRMKFSTMMKIGRASCRERV